METIKVKQITDHLGVWWTILNSPNWPLFEGQQPLFTDLHELNTALEEHGIKDYKLVIQKEDYR